MRRIERLFIQSPREIVLAGLFSALGVLLPILFHIVGLGKTFLPMHLPILTLGFLASPATVAAAGFVTPWVSSFLTGMPPLPITALMCIELPVLGAMASLAYRVLHLNLWLSLLVAILVRALCDLLLAVTIAPIVQLPAGAFGIATIIAGLPGVALQIIVVPLTVKFIERMQRERGGWLNVS